MFERLEICPICESESIRNDRIIKDHSISQEEFALTTCENCHFLFTNPRPTAENLTKYYDSEEYISHQNKSNSIINLVYSLARKFTLSWKYRITAKHISVRDPKSRHRRPSHDQ